MPDHPLPHREANQPEKHASTLQKQAEEEAWWDYCPNCGHRLYHHFCKYRCPHCHYFYVMR